MINGRSYFVPYEKIFSKRAACKLFRSFVRPSFVRRDFFVDAKIVSTARKFLKKSLGRRDRFRPKIVEIGAILAIFRPFEVSELEQGLQGLRRLEHGVVEFFPPPLRLTEEYFS